VLDVKVGSGAFMKTLADARTLARTMVGIGREMGKKVVALLTDMEQPLGRAVGNALEVDEAVAVLRGKAPPDLTECTMALCAEMLVLAKITKGRAEARARLERCVADGSALKKFAEIVQAQGGDPRFIDDPAILPRAKRQRPVSSPTAGYVTHIDTEAVGLAAVALGAGRAKVDSVVDPAVGFTLERKVGEHVGKGEPLVQVHLNDQDCGDEIERRLQAAYKIGDKAPAPRPLVLERVE
jgi:pyrimidine-nucleoside phosphorylase